MRDVIPRDFGQTAVVIPRDFGKTGPEESAVSPPSPADSSSPGLTTLLGMTGRIGPWNRSLA
jgi:hypothetical protein